MTDAETDRLVKALVAKWRRAPHGLSDEALEGIIGTTVADTQLVMDGTLPLEDYERVA